MIWMRPPKSSATRMTMATPAALSRFALYMPSMKDVAASAVTAQAPGSARLGLAAAASVGPAAPAGSLACSVDCDIRISLG